MGIVLTDIALLNMNTAISTNFLLWALLMFCCPDPGWTTQAEMTNIMDRMTRMEAEIIAKDEMMEKELEIRDEKIAFLEAAMETKDQRIAVLEDAKDVFTDAIETRNKQMLELEEEMKSLTGRINVTEETDVLLRGLVDQVRNPPYAFQCAYKEQWTAADSVITYDRLTYDEISGGSIYNVTGGLDINTGVFTVGQGYSGVWEISYSTKSQQHSGEQNNAWLYINGEQIEESRHQTYYTGSGVVQSLGSRSLYMRLESGDTISLRTGTVGSALLQITLC